MNAVVTAKKMATELTNAGFDVEVSENETMFRFHATSKNEWYDTMYMFSGFVITENKRPRKYFSAVQSKTFSKSEAKRNISYSKMWNEIEWAIRMSKGGK
jgi:hypothetical protein